MKFLKNLSKKEISGKICLLRVDLNISKKEIKTSQRIFGILPTIKFLTDNGAKVVILSHRGRPDKKCQMSSAECRELSLKPFVKILSSLLKQKVNFINFKNEFNIFKISNTITRDSITLLDNLRFLKGEEKNDNKFAKQLASLGDFYVNDAFSVCHRNVASVSAIVKFLPSYAGLLLEKEIINLDKAIKNYKKPFVAILGGAKISDKIGLIDNFKNKTDYFLIGGGIAHNFLLAQGLPIGDSIFEESAINFAKKMLNNKKIVLPVDYAIKGRKILDIGPNTAQYYSGIIKKAKTIIWNGPMGYFEDKKFAEGSKAIARAIIGNKKAFSVIGGGETAFLMLGFKNRMPNIFISIGGGAMLEYLAGKNLPGIKALETKN